jgi:hypothetical protein
MLTMSIEKNRPEHVKGNADSAEPKMLSEKAQELLAIARPLQEPGRVELVELVDLVSVHKDTLTDELSILAEQTRLGAERSDVEHTEELINIATEQLRESMNNLRLWVLGYQQGYTSSSTH